MGDPRSAGLFAALRAAARVSEERFLVGTTDGKERARIAEALSAEGSVTTAGSADEALDRLAAEPFEIAVFEVGNGRREPLAAARELRPFTGLVFLADGDPARCPHLVAPRATAGYPS